MAHRIEPFRDYSEHEVINLFALDLAETKKLNADADGVVSTALNDMMNLKSGQWDSGVVVAAAAGDMNGKIPSVNNTSGDLREYLGHAHSDAHIGWNSMPSNVLTVKPSNALGKLYGITLRQTVAYDENGENLLRYPVKKDELQAVGPGETVPVLQRGLVLLNANAFVDFPAAGDSLTTFLDADNPDGFDKAAFTDHGKFGPVGGDLSGTHVVGMVLAVDETDSTNKKALVKLSF